MTLRPASFDRELLAARSSLYAFAYTLTRNADDAHDLTQEALTRALTHWYAYTPGTRMAAWLFTMARNLFYTKCAKAKRHGRVTICDLLDAYDDPDKMPHTLVEQPGAQEPALLLKEAMAVVETIPTKQRETLMLIALGESYESTANAMHCNVGTVKSRLNRARARLQEAVA